MYFSAVYSYVDMAGRSSDMSVKRMWGRQNKLFFSSKINISKTVGDTYEDNTINDL